MLQEHWKNRTEGVHARAARSCSCWRTPHANCTNPFRSSLVPARSARSGSSFKIIRYQVFSLATRFHLILSICIMPAFSIYLYTICAPIRYVIYIYIAFTDHTVNEMAIPAQRYISDRSREPSRCAPRSPMRYGAVRCEMPAGVDIRVSRGGNPTGIHSPPSTFAQKGSAVI